MAVSNRLTTYRPHNAENMSVTRSRVWEMTKMAVLSIGPSGPRGDSATQRSNAVAPRVAAMLRRAKATTYRVPKSPRASGSTASNAV